QVSGPQAERQAPDPQAERQVSGPQAERRAPDPQEERQVSGPQAERRAPDPQAERQVYGPPGGAVGTETPGTTVGSESTGNDRRHWVRHWMVWLDSGHRGHQASGHLARQRALRHLARQWAPSPTGMNRGHRGRH
ncbi:unnamed protein product, partial [Staurois parvus]